MQLRVERRLGMLSVRPISEFSEENLISLGHYSFSSNVVFDVQLNTDMGDDRILFELKPKMVAEKVVYPWPVEGFEMSFFKKQIAAGYAIGLYDDEPFRPALVGLGIGQSMPWSKTLQISLLHVAENHRNKGGGRLLLEALEKTAQSLGLVHLSLEAQNTNGNALEFYQHCGYEITGVDLGRYKGAVIGEEHVAVFMRKQLKG